MELFQQFPNFSVGFALFMGFLGGYFVGKIRTEKKAKEAGRL